MPAPLQIAGPPVVCSVLRSLWLGRGQALPCYAAVAATLASGPKVAQHGWSQLHGATPDQTPRRALQP